MAPVNGVAVAKRATETSPVVKKNNGVVKKPSNDSAAGSVKSKGKRSADPEDEVEVGQDDEETTADSVHVAKKAKVPVDEAEAEPAAKSASKHAAEPAAKTASKPAATPEKKGKGKQEITEAGERAENGEEEDDEEEDDYDDVEEEENNESDEEDDNMAEIDASNIVQGGRRTRGRVIDYAKAAAENPPDASEEEEDEDDDFVAAADDKIDE